jgi:pyruvate/2-oxoglutarate dehydrogenase complex dihydrolipoamide dehydrogenase (E3) component
MGTNRREAVFEFATFTSTKSRSRFRAGCRSLYDQRPSGRGHEESEGQERCQVGPVAKKCRVLVKQLQNCTVYQGHARFTSPTEVSLGTTLLTATRIFINVGGRAQTPPMPGLDQVEHFTNSSMMDVDFLPRHLVVIGGSYVGLEFGQMYRRFGSEVTIIEMGRRLIHREDEDVSTEVKKILEREGINVRLNAKGAFTHTAYNDYEIVAANILDKDARRVSDRIPAYALYIDPPLGRVGMSETEVRSARKPALVGKRPMTKVSRAIEKGETQGFMKIVSRGYQANLGRRHFGDRWR